MMKLATIFEQLTYGELSQLALGGSENGKITEDNQRKVVVHVVLGLTALYKRFALKEGRLTVALQDAQTVYPLQSKYAVNGVQSLEPERFIIDTVAAPFRDDILKIERIIAVDTEFEMALNNAANIYACSTPAMDTLRVPDALVLVGVSLPDEYKTASLTVIYRANHPTLVPRIGYFDPERVNVELPDSYLQALLFFVASRVHNPIGMNDQSRFNAGNNYAAKYEQECQRLEMDGLEIDQGSQNTGIHRNGWV